jgi:type II secretory pathway pseudopilin PulG
MRKQGHARGFTMVEILVSIGIIVLLMALLIPYVSRAVKQSTRMRAQGDFQAISTALEAYRQEFGDIPRIPLDSTGTPMKNTGAAILAKALLGPFGDGYNGAVPDASDPPQYSGSSSYKAGDCVWAASPNVTYVALRDMPANTDPTNAATFPFWTKFDPHDGADGPGFRVRQGGKVFPPYLDPAKVKTQGCAIIDPYGHPILYFPARPGRINPALANSSPGAYVDQSPLSMFNANDNFDACRRDGEGSSEDPIVLARIQIMFGDFHSNGYVESSEGESAFNEPYILWSAGTDGLFGPAGYSPPTSSISAEKVAENKKMVAECDDVMNVQK